MDDAQTAFSSAPERWQAVQQRLPAADGQFFYAVRTTGVYCRPSCPARRPRREHVQFFEEACAAEQAGYRACKRCHPAGVSGPERQAALIARACRRIEASAELPATAELAQLAAMSRFHFQRVFKRVTGLSPKAYMEAQRAGRLRAVLPRSRSVTEALLEAGFNSSTRFHARSAEAIGMPTRAFRAGGAEQAIRYAIGRCTLGAVLVAASTRGLCALLLGDDAATLRRELQQRFPNARLVGADRAFNRLVGSVIGLVEHPGPEARALPLDLRGTAFQHRVWNALRRVPTGTTVSYAQLARRIGLPQGARAVAGAVAANPVAILVPCHRVVRSDGTVGGYRWGLERKRALLAAEARDMARPARPAP
ncbi:MAG TPA: bifunctional DNA-binding transcriptional regulator/O6-methylguanine-DNA methyltransferase Ada [Steroidobacteraceae bacterium]|nr:bifunctional DNA-binding transcriptional regulator/O6-methylguanine-DNA methyltransferase Ada [Steroidobacteraceae bacterium]